MQAIDINKDLALTINEALVQEESFLLSARFFNSWNQEIEREVLKEDVESEISDLKAICEKGFITEQDATILQYGVIARLSRAYKHERSRGERSLLSFFNKYSKWF